MKLYFVCVQCCPILYSEFVSVITAAITEPDPANMQDQANVGHQLAGLAKRRQICQRFANVINVLPTSLQKP